MCTQITQNNTTHISEHYMYIYIYVCSHFVTNTWKNYRSRCLIAAYCPGPSLRFKDQELNQITHLAIVLWRDQPQQVVDIVVQCNRMRGHAIQTMIQLKSSIHPSVHQPKWPNSPSLGFARQLLVVEEDVTIELFEPWKSVHSRIRSVWMVACPPSWGHCVSSQVIKPYPVSWLKDLIRPTYLSHIGTLTLTFFLVHCPAPLVMTINVNINVHHFAPKVTSLDQVKTGLFCTSATEVIRTTLASPGKRTKEIIQSATIATWSFSGRLGPSAAIKVAPEGAFWTFAHFLGGLANPKKIPPPGWHLQRFQNRKRSER